MQSDDLLYPDIKFGWTMNVYYSNTYCCKKYTNKYIYDTCILKIQFKVELKEKYLDQY